MHSCHGSDAGLLHNLKVNYNNFKFETKREQTCMVSQFRIASKQTDTKIDFPHRESIQKTLRIL